MGEIKKTNLPASLSLPVFPTKSLYSGFTRVLVISFTNVTRLSLAFLIVII